MGGHDGDAPSTGTCNGIGNGHSFRRGAQDTHPSLHSKFEFDGETEEVKLTAEEKPLLREACNITKLV